LSVVRLEPAIAPRAAPPPALDAVLVIRFGRVGDLLALTPALRALRALGTAPRVELLTTDTGRATLADQPGLAAIHTLGWRRVPAPLNPMRTRLVRRLRGRFDAVFVFETASRHRALAAALRARRTFGLVAAGAASRPDDVVDAGGHAAVKFDRVLARAGVPHAGWHYDYVVSPAAHTAVGARLAAAGLAPGEPVLVVHAGHFVRRRRATPHPKAWPEARWVAVIRELSRRYGLSAVLTGSRAEARRNARIVHALPDARPIDLAGRTTLPELAALLARAHLVVSGDTGPAHLAAAVHAPLVALFGPTPPYAMGPLGDESRIRRLYPEPARPARGTDGHHPRMWATTVDDVLRAADALLTTARPPADVAPPGPTAARPPVQTPEP
jgi:ADP-heptose:LPS heptosyltransferase